VSADREVHAVLGRYSPHPPAGDEVVEVRLLNFPLQLFQQAREHHDELLREFALLALRPPQDRPGHSAPARLLELIDLLGRRYATTAERADALRDEAIDRGEVTADLTYHLPRSAAPALRALHELMEEADEFCRSAQLLTRPSSGPQRAFREWFLDQLSGQLGGAAPEPWQGPAVDPDGA
jgi:hypothetical protein